MIKLPIEYTKDIFFQYAGYSEKTSSGYRASCPMCMEGKSWGTKKRLYYFPNEDYLFCHNGCGSFSDYFWVKKVTGKTFQEIKEDVESCGYSIDLDYFRINLDDEKSFIVPQPLPRDSINMFDKTQVLYYKDNKWVKEAVRFITKRGLLHAPYRPKAFYLSLTDKIHKNRLTIPFFDDNGQVEFYQSRALTEYQENFGKFLSKLNSDKSVFNLDKVNYSNDCLFIMEGAIDAMFLENAVAISGVYMTGHQEELIAKSTPTHTKVWIFDNPKIDNTGREKLIDMVTNGSSDLFFTWSDKFESYKDLNEFCIKENIWSINPDEILKRSVVGSKIISRI
jgi:hypothetical protein